MPRYRRLVKALTEYIGQAKKEARRVEEQVFMKPPETIERYRSIWELKGKIIVIAEKPKAARRIASALASRGSLRQYRSNRVPYWIIRRDGAEVIVAPSAGHLFGLYTSERGYPTFTYEWKPLYIAERGAGYTRKFLNLLSRLCRDADYYINACDYDIEGSVIGYLIIRFYGDPSRALRAKFSALTPDELRKAFAQLSRLDIEMVEAGLCRHELDWIWGINVSRALMSAVKEVTGKRIVLSAGRVQTPTLKRVVDNEIERNLYIPLPQYSITASISYRGSTYILEYKGDTIETRADAEKIVVNLKRDGVLKVTDYREERWSIKPPPPFNLGDLQDEAARIYGFSPYKTQTIAEQLYLNAYISYPRTNSQKLPQDLNYRAILGNISKIYQYNQLVKQLLRETGGVLKPVQGPKEDPAHPAIYPTGVIPKGLKSDEQKIYDLIVRRFLAVFAKPARIIHRIAYFKPQRDYGYKILFVLSGKQIVYKGWFRYYPFHTPSEEVIPVFRAGAKVNLEKVRVRRSYTKPPEKLSKIKLLKWMESVEIGTEATRARIIEVLFKRGYLVSRGNKIDVTDLGLSVIEVLNQYFTELTSVDLTRKFEEYIEMIRFGKINRRKVIEEAKDTLLKLLTRFEKKKKEVGLKLAWRLKLVSPENRCKLCSREQFGNGLCLYHYKAYTRLRETYEEWSKREGVSWREYIENIRRLKNTGKWIIEVAKELDNLMVPEG